MQVGLSHLISKAELHHYCIYIDIIWYLISFYGQVLTFHSLIDMSKPCFKDLGKHFFFQFFCFSKQYSDTIAPTCFVIICLKYFSCAFLCPYGHKYYRKLVMRENVKNSCFLKPVSIGSHLVVYLNTCYWSFKMSTS